MLDEFEARGVELPVMISVTITDRSGRTLSGQTLDAFYVSIRHARPFSVGINCAFGASQMRPYVAELSRLASEYVTCHPNAGLPERVGRVRRSAARDRAAPPRVRRGRGPQHRRRLLRHDPGAHPRDSRSGRDRPREGIGRDRGIPANVPLIPDPDPRSPSSSRSTPVSRH